MAPKRVKKGQAKRSQPVRALGISEIVLNILCHVRCFAEDDVDSLNRPTRESRRHVFQAALVCRKFAEAAQAILWDELPSVMPLVKLLPVRNVDDTYLLKEELTPQNLLRFNCHARQVHYIHAECSLPIDLSVILALNTAYHGQSMLPALVGLTISCHRSGMPVHLMLLSHTLRHLVINAPRMENDSVSAVTAVLSSPALSGTRLLSLRLQSSMDTGQLCAMLAPFQHLRQVAIRIGDTPIESALLRQLLRLPHIQALSVECACSAANTWHLRLQARGVGLESLTSLYLCAQVAALQPLMDMLSVRAVSAITLALLAPDVRAPDWVHAWRAFSDTVVARFGASLRDVCLMRAHSWYAGGLEGDISVLQPWFALRELNAFTIEGRSLLKPCTDAEMLALARAWPRATRLVLKFSNDYSCRATLMCLAAFALHCPLLESLEIGLMEYRNPEDPLQVAPVLAHPLTTLTITGAEGFRDSMIDVAEYLYRLFPAVTVKSPKYMSKLTEVNDALGVLRRVVAVHDFRVGEAAKRPV